MHFSIILLVSVVCFVAGDTLSGTGQFNGFGYSASFSMQIQDSTTSELASKSVTTVVSKSWSPRTTASSTSFVTSISASPTKGSPQSWYSDGSSAPTTTISSTSSLPTHTVYVGAFIDAATHGTVVEFRPNHVFAQPGTTVLFNMLAAAHSVTESSFDSPCIHSGGFDTELVPNQNNVSMQHLRSYRVDSTEPAWFYCKQIGHCQKGMVFAINPKSDEQLQDFVSRARGEDQTSVSATMSLNSPTVSEVCLATPTASFAVGSHVHGTGTGTGMGTGTIGSMPQQTGVGWNATNPTSRCMHPTVPLASWSSLLPSTSSHTTSTSSHTTSQATPRVSSVLQTSDGMMNLGLIGGNGVAAFLVIGWLMQ